LEETLKRERENLQGSALEREQALKREIEEWKKRVQEKQKENEDLAKLLKLVQEEKAGLEKEIEDFRKQVAQLQAQIEDLKQQLKFALERLESS
jgi:septal ring factor EnvC (AmiA/AmiB activator)